MIVAVIPKIQAQEEFLRLDSIVVINQDLAISKVVGRSYDYEGHDSLTIPRGINQIIKVRYCGITMRNDATAFGSSVIVEYYNRIYELGISTKKYSLINALDAFADRPIRIDNYNSVYGGKKRKFDCYPNIFLDENEKLYIDYIQSWESNGSRQLSYRIELIYYSYE
jgi:hypothetical protein